MKESPPRLGVGRASTRADGIVTASCQPSPLPHGSRLLHQIGSPGTISSLRKPKLYKGEGRVQSCAAAGVTLWVVEVRKVGCAAENSIACIAIPFVRHPPFFPRACDRGRHHRWQQGRGVRARHHPSTFGNARIEHVMKRIKELPGPHCRSSADCAAFHASPSSRRASPRRRIASGRSTPRRNCHEAPCR